MSNGPAKDGEFLRQVYDLKTQDDTDAYYSRWAASYDDHPFPFTPGTFAAIAAVGVIGIGAAPASLLTRALDVIATGGHLVFSYNDHALEVAEYPQALDDAITTGVAEQVFSERGPHIEGPRQPVHRLRAPTSLSLPTHGRNLEEMCALRAA